MNTIRPTHHTVGQGKWGWNCLDVHDVGSPFISSMTLQLKLFDREKHCQRVERCDCASPQRWTFWRTQGRQREQDRIATVCALPFAGQTLIPTDRVGSAYKTRINRHHPRARFCIIPKRNSGAAKSNAFCVLPSVA